MRIRRTGASMYPSANPSQRYRELQVHSASPLQLTLMVYDAAIVGCAKRDLKRATDAISVLRNSLDFEQGGQVAADLFALYQYCADKARAGDFDEAARVLRGLVQAWVEVLVRDTDARRAQLETRNLSLAG